MKEFLDIFIFKPKRTERMIIFILKVSFAFCYSIWTYKYYGHTDIVEQITDINKLKYFLFDGHFILFIFLFLLLYFIFFKFSTILFSASGMLSMWVFQAASRIILNVLAFLLSLIAWPFIRKFNYRPFWKILKNNEPLNQIGGIFKWLFLKAGLLKSPEQRIHSSKEATKLLKEMKIEIIENGDRIYNKMHMRFVFVVLLYIFYFYGVHAWYKSIPHLDGFIYYFCLVVLLLQLLSYWAYNHFRIIYYIFIVAYRDIHRNDVFLIPFTELLDKVEIEKTR
jgi:hypothetical protein